MMPLLFVSDSKWEGEPEWHAPEEQPSVAFWRIGAMWNGIIPKD